MKERESAPLCLHTIEDNGYGGKACGVIRTDEWLKNDFDDLGKISSNLLDYFNGEGTSRDIYQYLRNFGMYNPSRKNQSTFSNLVDANAWESFEHLFFKYKRRWNGPDIPILIFPFDESNRRLMREGKGKSGVSFRDKLFLFLTAVKDEKEWEALFVHEYHHCCRMNRLKKDPQKYNLLDSIVLEGLAEHAVEFYCGKKYNSDWTRRYTKEELSKYWKNNLLENLLVERKDKLHDQLLFGLGSYPPLIGYALGYEIIRQYRQSEQFSIKKSIMLPAKKFIKDLDL